MDSAPFTPHQRSLIDCCLNTLAHIIPISGAAYYLVDEQWRAEHYVLYGISLQIHQHYLDHFQLLDPLQPANFKNNDQQVIGLYHQAEVHDHAFYRKFMCPNNLCDRVEIFVRQRNKIIAGISVLRNTPFQHHEITRLRAILPIAELATFDILPELRTNLTPKEVEVVQLVREGASNKRIALLLNISLSTVKTHLRNIFAKTKVTSRTELVSSGFIIKQ